MYYGVIDCVRKHGIVVGLSEAARRRVEAILKGVWLAQSALDLNTKGITPTLDVSAKTITYDVSEGRPSNCAKSHMPHFRLYSQNALRKFESKFHP